MKMKERPIVLKNHCSKHQSPFVGFKKYGGLPQFALPRCSESSYESNTRLQLTRYSHAPPPHSFNSLKWLDSFLESSIIFKSILMLLANARSMFRRAFSGIF